MENIPKKRHLIKPGLFLAIILIATYSAYAQMGTAETEFRGTVNIQTQYYNGMYRLYDSIRNIITLDIKNTNPKHECYDDDNVWTPKNRLYDVHWGTEVCYDYFKSKFDMNSYDNKGSLLTNNVNVGYASGAHASAGGGSINFLNQLSPESTCLDVVAHEYTHNVTCYSSNLNIFGENGALNEGFSNIFAICIAYNLNKSTNWITYSYNFNYFDKSSADRTKKYKDALWQDTNWEANDDGGVHINCILLHYWFYLLTMGGTIPNSQTQKDIILTGIGMEKSERIAYRTLTAYIKPTSSFPDARNASIAAALELYPMVSGEISNEVIQVINVWDLLGVPGFGVKDIKESVNLCGNILDETNLLATNDINVSNNCSEKYANVNKDDTVKLTAINDNNIYLKPGFNAKYGCTFEAKIIKRNTNTPSTLKSVNISEIKTSNKPSGNSGSIFISPIPANDYLNILFSGSEFEKVSYKIYSIEGVLICSGLLTANNTANVDIADLKNGNYLIHFETDEKIEVKKFIVIK